MGSFRRLFRNFFGIFYNFSEFSTIFLENFCDFLENFCNFFGKFLQFFCDFSENFSENFRSQSITVQPGSRHYCKFTIKFTLILILILIKILQSTKFEGSHFYSFLSIFPTFPNLFASLCSFPFATAFSQP